MSKQKSNENERLIARNKKAYHDYFVESRFEAGLVLEGWEVKSLRAGRAQLRDSYAVLKEGEAWVIGAHISPLSTASTHINPDPVRSRKLLLHKKEIKKLETARDRQGYTIVILDLHWTNNRVKALVAIAKGKKQHDKREASKQRDWQREKQRLMKK